MNQTDAARGRNLPNMTENIEDPSPLDEAIENFQEKRTAPHGSEAHEGRKPYPKLAGGGQLSFKLTGRITRYVEERSSRHGVSKAEVVRSMLNAQIDNEEAIQRSLLSTYESRDQP